LWETDAKEGKGGRRLTCRRTRGGDEGDRSTRRRQRQRAEIRTTAALEGESESKASRHAEQGGPGSCYSRLHAAAAAGKATPTVNNNDNPQRDNVFRYKSSGIILQKQRQRHTAQKTKEKCYFTEHESLQTSLPYKSGRK
jgi:hypothetical protein